MAFRIVRDDITRMKVDAIVNTANPKPLVGSGVDRAIYQAAGYDELLAKRQEIGDISRGDAVITPAFNLDAKYIIHTVGPLWEGGIWREEKTLKKCYERCLQLAAENNCESIAFPFISTGNYGFPKKQALKIAFSVISQFLLEQEMMIYLVVFDEETVDISAKVYDVEENIDNEEAAVIKKKEYHNNSLIERRRRLDLCNSYSVIDECEEDSEPVEPMCSAPMPSMAPMPQMPSQKTQKSGLFGGLKSAAPKQKKRSLDDVLNNPGETFQQMLLRLIDEKGYTNAQAYTKANQSKQTFSKIKNDVNYQPKKKTVFAFAIALELNLDQTRDLLARAGYAFSAGLQQDLAVEYFIGSGVYDIFEIEEALFDHNIECLCTY